MQGKMKQNSRGFWWPAVLAVATSAACGAPPAATEPQSSPPPPAASAKPTARAAQATQTVQLVTAHVTAADVGIAPDGKWLVFNALGHLYRLSSKGGDAKQLTFGPYYDSQAAISPDGNRIAFISNRGARSLASVFLLNLSTGELTEVARGPNAQHPAWSPDGKSLAFLSWPLPGASVSSPAAQVSVRRIDLAADRISTVSPPARIGAVAFLNDGRLAWSETDSATSMSRIVAAVGTAKPTTQLNVKGFVRNLAPDRKSDQVFLEVHRTPSDGPADPEAATILSARLPGGEPERITTVENVTPSARFSALNGQLWLCEHRALWSVDALSGKKQPLRLSLEAALEVFPRATPHWALPATHPAALLDPRAIGNTGGVLFTAAGYLWHQPAGASQPKRVFNERDGYEWGPAAPSPDGKRIAFQVSQGATQELRIADLGGTNLRTVTTSDRSVNFQPAWHPSGTQVAYVAASEGAPYVHLVELATGKRSKLATEGTWQPTPHFSDDGKWLYFAAKGQVQRVSLDGKSNPEAITDLSMPFDRALVAPHGQTLALGRDDEIWVAPIASGKVRDAAFARVSTSGGRSFSFAPGSPNLIYASGPELWQQAVGVPGQRTHTPLQLAPTPSEALLVRNVRPLDLERGVFQPATSLYIDKGRIQWIGAESEHKLAPDTKVLDGAGRFAIPGLIDLHTSIAARNPMAPHTTVGPVEAFVAFGVTTVLDVGGDPALVQSWADRRQAFGTATPRILSHPSVIKTLSFSSLGEPVLSEAELRERVRVAKAQGAHGITAAPNLPWALQLALADEAVKQGLVVSGRSPQRDALVTGAILGQWSALGLPATTPWADDLVQLLAKTQTHLITTVSSPWGNRVLFQAEPERRNLPLLLAFTSPSERALPETGAAAPLPGTQQPAYDRLLGGLQLAHHDDVDLAPGSGAPGAGCFYGHCLHTELWHLHAAGLTPIQALRQATLGNAEALGAADHLGSIQAGKLADLVLLDKDPLVDLHDSLSIATVISEGRPFKDGKPLALPTPTPTPSPAPAPATKAAKKP